jgi:hypothetical protein
MMRRIRLLIAAAIAGGATVVLKRLLSEEDRQAVSPATRPEPRGAGAEPASSPSGPSQSATSPSHQRSGSANGAEPTKAELYERAQELGIEGRSKMSKRELQRAIESAT